MLKNYVRRNVGLCTTGYQLKLAMKSCTEHEAMNS